MGLREIRGEGRARRVKYVLGTRCPYVEGTTFITGE